MTVLLNKIKDRYPDVAQELEKADFRSDYEIRTLTREDLHELLRGPENLKRRKAVYELIHEQKPIDMLLKDLKAFIPAESLSAALTENGDLIGYLRILKDLTSQAENIVFFLQAHVTTLEEHHHDNKAPQGIHTRVNEHPTASEGMFSTLWNSAFGSPGGKSVAGLPKSSAQSCNSEDFGELYVTNPAPAPSNPEAEEPLTAFDADPVTEPLPSVTTQQMSTTEGKSVAGLPKSSAQSCNSEDFGELYVTNPAPAPSNPEAEEPLTAFDADPVTEPLPSVTTQQMSTTEELPTVRFLSIVSGQTLDSENKLMDRLRNQGRVSLVEAEESEDPHLIIMFCPITSRIDSDLESAMSKRPVSLLDKPVILVMMHHVHKPNEDLIQKPSSFPRKWNIVLGVNVFFHDTVHGLLPCISNNQAVIEMHAALLKHFSCEGVGDLAKLDTCSRDSKASELLVGAGNDYIGTCSSGNNVMVVTDQQSCSQEANVGEVGSLNRGQTLWGKTSDFQGNQEDYVGNRCKSRFIQANVTEAHGLQRNQLGSVGKHLQSRFIQDHNTGYGFQDNKGDNVRTAGRPNDHMAGKVETTKGWVSGTFGRFLN